MSAPTRSSSCRILPLTPARWPQLEQLFGTQGACAGCWCMWMRLPLAEHRGGAHQATQALARG